MLLDFIKDLVPVENVPEIYEVAKIVANERTLTYEYPEVEAIFACLQLKDYINFVF